MKVVYTWHPHYYNTYSEYANINEGLKIVTKRFIREKSLAYAELFFDENHYFVYRDGQNIKFRRVAK